MITDSCIVSVSDRVASSSTASSSDGSQTLAAPLTIRAG